LRSARRPSFRHRAAARRGGAALLAGLLGGAALGQQGEPGARLPRAEVIGTTPMPGGTQPLADVPTNARVYSGRSIENAGPAGTTRALDDRGASFSVDDTAGNRYLADLSFRGFTASPLLGSAQGLSVFLDGVRINEAFGDVVDWDLVPRNALAAIAVLPGAAPSFGLNTLGAALSLTTKSGAADPGTEAVAGGGSFRQRSIEFSHGAAANGADWFVAATAANDDGWRDYSGSSIRQVFAKAGWQDGRTRAELSAGGADNRLNGTQALPVSWLDTPKQAYTWPDSVGNRLAFATATARHALVDGSEASLRLFYRDVSQRGFNSNVNDECAQGPCAFNAVNDTTAIDEQRSGAAVQWIGTLDSAGATHRVVGGASVEWGDVRFEGASQPAMFTEARGTVAAGGFEIETATRTTQRYESVFVADTLAIDAARVTAALTYVGSRLSVRDTTGLAPELNGDHGFNGWLPALGLTWGAASEATWFASAARGMRAPTAIELTCADPDAPCRLPNLFLADPPLKAVKSNSYEAGVRARAKAGPFAVRASAALFRVDLIDDIQFVSAGGAATNAGYFRNVGRTQRQGGEVSLEAAAGPFAVEASYMRLAATYLDGFTTYSPNNSSADAQGDIVVAPGDRLPGLPRDAFKLHGAWSPADGSSLGMTLVAYGPRYARGDENNRDASGPIPGYALVHLDAALLVGRNLGLVAEVRNVFDHAYASGGVLGANFFTGPGRTFSADYLSGAFRTPGSPRSFWLGLRYAAG